MSSALSVLKSAIIACCLTALIFICPAFAQAHHDDQELIPIYVTVRIFQLSAKKSSNLNLSDQVFRLRTSALTDYEKWISHLGKAYPGYTIAQLRTQYLKVFKTPRPAIARLGVQEQPNLQLHMLGAGSPSGGTSLIPQVEYHFGQGSGAKPLSLALPEPVMDAEIGATYFFTSSVITFKPETYVNFVRPGVPWQSFVSDDIYIMYAFSMEASDPLKDTSLRILEAKASEELQKNALKKVEPVWPEEIKKRGFVGYAQVRAEIAPDGRVSHATIWNSSLPEANQQAITAAREWEFPTTIFADNKTPAIIFLNFNYKASESNTGEAKGTNKGKPKSPAKPRPTRSRKK